MNFLSKLKVSFFGEEEEVKSKVKAGQVWGYIYREGNPFMEPIYHKAIVLEVREDWVMYESLQEKITHIFPIHSFNNMYDELLEDVE
jgi:hypothetical protein